MKKEKTTHGGARQGSGRKKGEESKTISFRIPKENSELIKEKMTEYLNFLKIYVKP